MYKYQYNLFRYHKLQIAFIITDITHKIAYNLCNYRYHGIYCIYKLRALYTVLYCMYQYKAQYVSFLGRGRRQGTSLFSVAISYLFKTVGLKSMNHTYIWTRGRGSWQLFPSLASSYPEAISTIIDCRPCCPIYAYNLGRGIGRAGDIFVFYCKQLSFNINSRPGTVYMTCA